MATVFRQVGSPYWYTAFFDGSGRRLRRSTKKIKRNEAVRVAAEMERLARQTVSYENDERSRQIYAILEEAGSQALRGQLNEASGRVMLNRILEVATGNTIHVASIESWLRDWLKDKEGSRTAGTYQRYRGVVDSFLEFLPATRRAAPLPSLAISEIRDFRDKLHHEGRSPTTVNMAVKILRSPLNLARKQGLVTHNPTEAVEPIAVNVEEKGVFSAQQVASDDRGGKALSGKA